MQSKSFKTLSAILVVLVLSTLSCEFSFDLGGVKDPTATRDTSGYLCAVGARYRAHPGAC